MTIKDFIDPRIIDLLTRLRDLSFEISKVIKDLKDAGINIPIG